LSQYLRSTVDSFLVECSSKRRGHLIGDEETPERIGLLAPMQHHNRGAHHLGTFKRLVFAEVYQCFNLCDIRQRLAEGLGEVRPRKCARRDIAHPPCLP
jgi:hypothetical protein